MSDTPSAVNQRAYSCFGWRTLECWSSIHSSSNCWAASIFGQGGRRGRYRRTGEHSSDFPLCDSMARRKTFVNISRFALADLKELLSYLRERSNRHSERPEELPRADRFTAEADRGVAARTGEASQVAGSDGQRQPKRDASSRVPTKGCCPLRAKKSFKLLKRRRKGKQRRSLKRTRSSGRPQKEAS